MATACSDDGSSGQDTSTTEPTAGSTAGSTIGSTIGSTTGSTTAGTTGDSTGGTANADTTGPNDDSTSASTGQPETPTICPIDENFGDPVPEGAQPYPVALDFRGAEGIVWNADEQRLYFSEIFRQGAPEDCPLREDRMCGSIVRLDPQTGESEVFVTAASTNGLALPLEGGQLIAGSFTRDLVAFALDEGLEPEPVTFVPQRIRPPIFNSPNDLTIRSDGTIYFTDPWFGIPEKLQSGITPIWRVSPMGDVSIVTENTIVPNGIALSPDESTLYVTTRLVENEPENQRILQLDVQEDGTATNEREFVTLQGGGADGMTIDCAGNLYATLFRSGGGDDPGPPGVEIYRPSGELIQSITFPNPNDDTALLPATNAAFGGSDRTTLFVTVEQRNPDPALRVFGVYGVDLNIPGLPY
ncbi:MAG: SMP-30/gluconolactonase/LRE family protein [Myxococcota bacterium]